MNGIKLVKKYSKKFINKTMEIAKERLSKLTKVETPSQWIDNGKEIFDERYHRDFLKKLKEYDCDNVIKNELGGAEGKVFYPLKKKGSINLALKRWNKSKMNIFLESVNKLKNTRRLIKNDEALSKMIEVSKIHEVGKDYILRDFHPTSLKLKNVIEKYDKAKILKNKSLERLEKLRETTTGADKELYDRIYHKIRRNSANVHWWGGSNGKLLIFDMM